MTLTALIRPTAAGVALAVSMSLGACASQNLDPGTARASSGATSAPSRTENSTPDDRSDSPGGAQTGSENTMQLAIRIRDQRFTATLDDSAAARELLAQLPVTLDMVDHGGVEKTGPLPEPLSLEGQPEGADPDVGDLGYYAPGNDLVLYYGDQSYFPGIVVLGRLNDDAAQRIAQLHGPVTATLRAG